MNVPYHGSRPSSLLKHTRSKFVVLALVFIAYISVWSVLNWPALRQAWWYSNDFILAESWYVDDCPLAEQIRLSTFPIERGLSNGRPIEGLWFLTFLLDGSRDRELCNILIRFVQGTFHYLAATVAAILIWKQTGRCTAFFSVLPFLLWPFNGEAVLWRAAGSYPIAALFGLLGVYTIRHSERRTFLMSAIGTSSIAVAMLASQTAALAGMVVWMVTLSLRALINPSCLKKQLWFETSRITFGYVTGISLSYIIAQLFNMFSYQGAAFASDYVDKLAFFLESNNLFIAWPDFYPDWLTGLRVTLLLGSAALIVAGARQMGWSIRRVSLSLLFLMTAFVTPYATVLLVSESWPSWRVMYLAPFLFTGAWNLLDQAVGTQRVGAFVSIGLLSLILIGYTRITWINASEYVEVFEADIGVLHQMENYAAQEHITSEQVFVATAPDFIRDWNPHRVRYIHPSPLKKGQVGKACWDSTLP